MNKKKSNKGFEYLLTFFVVVTANFMIPRLMPGDPFTFLSSVEGSVNTTFSEEEIKVYKAYYGLDQPLHVQYVSYLKNLLKGNLGYSIYYKSSVISVISKRMVWTLSIVLVSIGISFLIGTIIGCLSAWHLERWWDKILYTLMIILSEVPSFILGLIFIFFVAAKSNFFPLAGGMQAFPDYNSFFERIFDLIRHAALPVLTLSMIRIGSFYLIARNSMIMVISKSYIQTARAKGLSQFSIIFKHAVKNAMIPIVTKLYLSLSAVFGGAVLVENVFNYPGIGRLIREAVVLRDYVLIQGIFLFITVLVLGLNYLADGLYRLIDPRIKEV